MPSCEFCQAEVPSPPHRLADSDVQWMTDILYRRHSKRHGVALDFAAMVRSDIEARLRRFGFCSTDCALAAGAESSLGSDL